MLKNIFLIYIAMCTVVFTSAAQGEDPLKAFKSKYGDREGASFGGKGKELIGKQLPTFHFSDQLNSTALKGRSIVLDFWATWCSGCLLLSKDLDSLLIKETPVYANTQLIGVNTQERSHERARTYWKQSGYGFPMVEGAAADTLGASVQNGFPTVMLVDGQGIIHGRWDAWTPSTAKSVRIAVWELEVYPQIREMQWTAENALHFMTQKDWVSAAYFWENIAENYDLTSIQRFEAMLYLDEEKAKDYLLSIVDSIRKSPNYQEYFFQLLSVLFRSSVDQRDLLNFGVQVCGELRRTPRYGNDYRLWGYNAVLHKRIATQEQQTAERMARKSLSMAEQSKTDTTAIHTLLKDFKKFDTP